VCYNNKLFLKWYNLFENSFWVVFTFLLIGPGEQGQAVILEASEEKEKQELYKVNGFNAYASDKISLHRSMKDIRHPE